MEDHMEIVGTKFARTVINSSYAIHYELAQQILDKVRPLQFLVEPEKFFSERKRRQSTGEYLVQKTGNIAVTEDEASVILKDLQILVKAANVLRVRFFAFVCVQC